MIWIGVSMRGDDDPWHVRAACHDHPDADVVFFPTHTQGRGWKRACEPAFIVCYGCPVRPECLEDALARERGLPVGRRFGVYAATTPQQRCDLDAHTHASSR